ncbi:MAG: hypothetical protein K6T94_20230 [Paenibacillus sp.]|nr:hypothetical protein [Paenibacillus sp.]
MSSTGAMRKARGSMPSSAVSLKSKYKNIEYRHARDRDTVLILVLFMLLIIFLLYFS